MTSAGRPHIDLVQRVLRYLWAPFAHLLWYTYTLVVGVVSLLIFPFDRSGRLEQGCARWWCRLVTWTTFVQIHVRGSEQIRPDRAYVFVANHASFLDVLALFASLPYPFRTMAKRELFWIPFIGWYMRMMGHFPIDRGNTRRAATTFRHVVARVKEGMSVAMFPEGTRTQDGRMQAMGPGAFKIALMANAPIVPVAIRGTFALMPRGTFMPKPGRIDVIVGAPIETTAYSAKTLPELIARTTAAIQGHL
jgi:1-acyl-sn-glycerol-3-phosphate acyltransferase